MSLVVDITVNGEQPIGRVGITRQHDGPTGSRYRWGTTLADGRNVNGTVWHRPDDGAWVLLERVCREIQTALGGAQ